MAVLIQNTKKQLIKYYKMMKKNSDTNEGTLQTSPSLSKHKRSSSQNTDHSKRSNSNSSASSRSKYVSGSRLVRSKLFDSLQGRKGSLKESQEQRSLQMELLQDTLGMAFRRESELLTAIKSDFRGYREQGRKLMRLLEHLTL